MRLSQTIIKLTCQRKGTYRYCGQFKQEQDPFKPYQPACVMQAQIVGKIPCRGGERAQSEALIEAHPYIRQAQGTTARHRRLMRSCKAPRVMRRGADLGPDAAAPEAGEGEEAGVVPAVHKALSDQPVQLALGQHVVRDVQACVLPHQRLVCVQHLRAFHPHRTQAHTPGHVYRCMACMAELVTALHVPEETSPGC